MKKAIDITIINVLLLSIKMHSKTVPNPVLIPSLYTQALDNIHHDNS